MAPEKPANAFTVDVEDWFQVSAFRHHIGRGDWDRCQLRVEANTERLLEILAGHNVRGTFFVLGWVAERVPALVQRIASAGHEVACHGYHHELVYDCSPAQFEELTHRAVGVLRELLGRPVTGYRAASFSLPRSERQWVYDILSRQGIQYDSSIFPIRRKFYGHPDAPWTPFDVTTPNGTLREYPLPVVKIAGQAFPFGGGGYFRLYPYHLTASCIRRANREGRPVVFYMHPWEIDPDQPRQNVGLATKFRHHVNIKRELTSSAKRNGCTDCCASSSSNHFQSEPRDEPEHHPETVTRHFDVTAEEFDSIYTGGGKGFWGKLLDRSFRKDMYERFRLTVENCGDDPDRTILDVGCGTGRFSIALAQRNARVDGIDPAPTMLAIATRVASEQGVADKCRFIEADLDSFHTPEKYYYVIGIGLLDYLATPAADLKRMTDLARKRVIVTFPRRWTWRAPIRKLRLSLRGCPVFFYDRAQVEKLVRDAGGQIEEIRVVGKIYFVMFAPTDSRRK